MDLVVARTDDGTMPSFLDRWFDGWAAAVLAGLAAGRDDPPLWHPRERLGLLRRPAGSYVNVVVAAVEAGRVLGGARVQLSRRDNPAVALVELAVAPAHRRRGVGRTLLSAVRDVAAADGRTSLLAEVNRPLGSGDGWPGPRFAAAEGLTMRQGDVRRVLTLPVPADLAAALAAEAGASSSGYRLRTWSGPAADADVDALAALQARMSTDAPLGDLEYEPEVWDGVRWREEEDEAQGQGYRWWTVLAETADGRPAGFSQLGVSRWQPDRAWQWDTLVLTEHRGHRLGLAAKLATLDALVVDEPSTRTLTTWNAASNGPMIAVNEAMGFRAVEVTQEWQGPVGRPDADATGVPAP